MTVTRTGPFTRTRTTSEVRPTTNSLTSLRWFAALFVLLHHEYTSFGPFSTLAFGGYLAVTVFFTLSGFVLTWSTPKEFSYKRFWTRRFARVFPLHAATWLAFWPLISLTHVQNLLVESGSSLLLVQSWIPNEDIYFGWNGPSWSLSCEAFFYALFPFALTVLRRLTTRMAWLLSSSAWLISATIQIYVAHFHQSLDHFVYVLPIIRLPEFLIGITLALTIRRGYFPIISIWRTVLLASLTVTVALLYTEPADVRGVVCAAAFWSCPAIILTFFYYEQNSKWFCRFVVNRSLLALGELSFAFYLVHYVTGKALRAAGVPSGYLLILATVVASLVVAYILNRAIERPARAWICAHSSAPIDVSEQERTKNFR